MDRGYPDSRSGSGYLDHFYPHETSYPDPDEVMQDQYGCQGASPQSHFTSSHGSPVCDGYNDNISEAGPSDNEDDLMDDIDDLVAQIRPDPRIPQDNPEEDPDFQLSQSDGP